MKKTGAVAVIFAYVIVALFLTWPLALNLDHHLLQKSYENINFSDTKVHLRHITRSLSEFEKTKTILLLEKGYTYGYTYVVSGMFFVKLTGQKPIIFHNIYFMLSITLSGYFTYLLAKHLHKDVRAAFLSGLIYMSSNYAFHQYYWGHSHIFQTQWIPLIFYLIEKTIKSQQLTYPALLGVAFSLQVFTSTQITTYLSAIIPSYLTLRYFTVSDIRVFDRVNVKKILVIASVILILTGYYSYKQMGMQNIKRSMKENTKYSWTVQAARFYYLPSSNVGFGAVNIVCLLIGLAIIILKKHPHYKPFIAYVILLPFLMALMVGPKSPHHPYAFLYRYWPFVQYFRVPKRIYPIAYMIVSILASSYIPYVSSKDKIRKYVVPLMVLNILLIYYFQVLGSAIISNTWLYKMP